jgi:periplasmic protein TonB
VSQTSSHHDPDSEGARGATRRLSPLDIPHKETRYLGASGGVGAIALHALLAFLALGAVSAPARVVETLEGGIDWIDVEPPPAEPPPRVEPPAPVKTPKVSSDRAPPPTPTAPSASAAPSEEAKPSAAEAGQVLAAEELVDFGESFVVGRGTRYAGGTTDAAGTSTIAVRQVGARGTGSGQGNGGSGAKPTRNLTRPPTLKGGASWDCPFPHEADDEGIHQAVATIEVRVVATGKVSAVSVLVDPGNGFGRAAKRCALNKDWSPGTNAEGLPVESTTTVRVRFER